MIRERLYNVIVSPHLSEKTTRVSESANQVTFRVAPDAKKSEIKEAVEKIFEKTVVGVSVLNVKGKVKGRGHMKGRRAGWRKAYVTLKEGDNIDFLDRD